MKHFGFRMGLLLFAAMLCALAVSDGQWGVAITMALLGTALMMHIEDALPDPEREERREELIKDLANRVTERAKRHRVMFDDQRMLREAEEVSSWEPDEVTKAWINR